MGILINYSLIICGVIALVAGISYFAREKDDHLLKQGMLILSIFAFLWCGGYSFMGFSDTDSLAYIGRTIGLFGVLSFIASEASLIIYLTHSFGKFRKFLVILLTLFTAIDLLLFSQPNVLEFTVVDGRTCYYALNCFARTFHGIYLFCNVTLMLFLGILWLKKCRFKERKIIRKLPFYF